MVLTAIRGQCLLVVACYMASAGAIGEAPTGADLPLPQACVSGFTSQDTASSSGQISAEDNTSNQLPPRVSQWLRAQHWQAGYQLWQRCRSGLAGPEAAACAGLPAQERICQGPQDGLAFLAMHRHILQSLRAAWPSYRDELASWRRFPEGSDYPADLQAAFTPWPSATARAAQAVDNLRSLPRAQLLARWPSEGAFGQWLQCGSGAGGLAVDSLYGALLGNSGLELSSHRFHSSVYWRYLAWIDRAWDAYRAKLGKTPDDPQLQALLIQQCQQFTALAQRASQLNPPPQPPAQPLPPLFVAGALNPNRASSWVSVLGEVQRVTSGSAGQVLIQLDMHLRGAQPLWLASTTALAGIQSGQRLRIGGYLQPAASLDSSGQLAARTQAVYLVQVESLQTIQ